jgi:tRNA(fMet)-specific endonuclease VapC
LLKPGVGVLYADEPTAHHYAAVYRQLRKQGTPIPTNDMWIAALVLQHSLVLFARDTHFDALPQLTRA